MPTELDKILLKYPVIYVSRDIERALALPPNTPGYYIISNYNNFANTKVGNFPNVLLLKKTEILDAAELLQTPEAAEFIASISPRPSILVFKPAKQVEKICAAKNWRLLNPSTSVTGQIEEKITQLRHLKDLAHLFPKYTVAKCQDIQFESKKLVLQFNHSHTGNGTLLISNKEILSDLQKKFPLREVRVTEFIDGPLFTNNNVVWPGGTAIGNISYQITGLSTFTDNPFATIGNDWALPNKILTTEQLQSYREIAKQVGHSLRANNMQGLFGLDMIFDTARQKWWLIEINARQPASTSYESTLQSIKKTPPQEKTIFEAHLLALLGSTLENAQVAEISDGAQIILRNKKNITEIGAVNKIEKRLQNAGFHCLNYGLNTPGSDLLRIQSQHGLMTDHNVLNSEGKIIEEIVKEEINTL